MTETDVPVLAVGREQSQLWTQLVLTKLQLLQQRRWEQDRLAWSTPEHAAREHDRVERVADPDVRAMDDRERAAWTRLRREQVDRRDVTGTAGTVSVAVGVVGRRWGLVAEGTASDGGSVGQAWVSCANESLAKRLADELLAAGPNAVQRLNEFGALAAERATAARADVRETEQQRLARTADAVREVWPGPLGEAVVSSPAFGALAYRLHSLEERGYAMSDVLGRIDADRLRRSDVRDPAALAEYFVKQLERSLQVIDSDDVDLDHNLGSDQGPKTAASGERAGEPAGQEVVDRLLAGAVPDELFQSLERSRSYSALQAGLLNLHEQGLPVDRLLTDLPLEAVRDAHDPAGYLASVVARRIQQGRPQQTEVDRTAMADLVRANVEQVVAKRVLDCKAWPALARRLAEMQQEGLPVADMLGSMSAEHVYAARKPAAYANKLMQLRADALRRSAAPDETKPAPDTTTSATSSARQPRAVGADTPAASDTTARAEPVDVTQGHIGAGELAARLRESRTRGRAMSGPTEPWPRRGGAPQTSGQSGSGGTPGPGLDALDDGAAVGDAPLAWTDHLNPNNPIDRVGLEATAGLGSVERNAKLDRRLGHSGSDAAHAAAGAAETRAASFERAAASDRDEVDDPRTRRREDFEGRDRGGLDDQLAAAERAEAAEQLGQATASAARAEVTYTPDHPQSAPEHVPGVHRQPQRLALGRVARPPTPSRERGRSR